MIGCTAWPPQIQTKSPHNPGPKRPSLESVLGRTGHGRTVKGSTGSCLTLCACHAMPCLAERTLAKLHEGGAHGVEASVNKKLGRGSGQGKLSKANKRTKICLCFMQPSSPSASCHPQQLCRHCAGITQGSRRPATARELGKCCRVGRARQQRLGRSAP
jgi:hypothetical protein